MFAIHKIVVPHEQRIFVFRSKYFAFLQHIFSWNDISNWNGIKNRPIKTAYVKQNTWDAPCVNEFDKALFKEKGYLIYGQYIHLKWLFRIRFSLSIFFHLLGEKLQLYIRFFKSQTFPSDLNL